MLADDPEHRPVPRSLIASITTRGRNAVILTRRQALRPMINGVIAVSRGRALAFELERQHQVVMKFLADRSIDTWIRRTLDNPVNANQIEELVRLHTAGISADGNGNPPISNGATS